MDDPTVTVNAPSLHDQASKTSEWRLTIVFHEDLTRIGHQAIFQAAASEYGDENEDSAVDGAGERRSIGRSTPAFEADAAFEYSHHGRSNEAGASVRGLGDVRVSRNALTLERSVGGWTVRRSPKSSSLRIEGEPVASDYVVSDSHARRGVLLQLGNAVVLHLRLQEPLSGNVAAPPGMLGVSPAARRVFADVTAAAQAESDVLLLGPTGTGKDLAARAIHALSARRAAPWVPVNMSALAPELGAASLFGVRRGAYTGADRNRAGYFQQAAGGTLYLDEIGDTPHGLQTLLLRALQDRELQVVGGAVETIDLRVIAATDQPIDAPDSDFRAALRYRLAAREIHLPPLSERREDIGLLAVQLLTNGDSGLALMQARLARSTKELTRWARLFEQLLCREWQGNVRELLNAVARVAESAASDADWWTSWLSAGGASGWRNDAETEPPPSATPVPAVAEEPASPRLRELSDREFLAAWEHNGHEVAGTARQFGTSRQAVYRRLGRLRECRLAADVPLRELLETLEKCRGDLRDAAKALAISPSGLKQRLRAAGVASTQFTAGG